MNEKLHSRRDAQHGAARLVGHLLGHWLLPKTGGHAGAENELTLRIGHSHIHLSGLAEYDANWLLDAAALIGMNQRSQPLVILITGQQQHAIEALPGDTDRKAAVGSRSHAGFCFRIVPDRDDRAAYQRARFIDDDAADRDGIL